MRVRKFPPVLTFLKKHFNFKTFDYCSKNPLIVGIIAVGLFGLVGQCLQEESNLFTKRADVIQNLFIYLNTARMKSWAIKNCLSEKKNHLPQWEKKQELVAKFGGIKQEILIFFNPISDVVCINIDRYTNTWNTVDRKLMDKFAPRISVLRKLKNINPRQKLSLEELNKYLWEKSKFTPKEIEKCSDEKFTVTKIFHDLHDNMTKLMNKKESESMEHLLVALIAR